jgi:hypothetical protein
MRIGDMHQADIPYRWSLIKIIGER